MTPQEARDYHFPQIATYRDAGIDLTSSITMTHVEEALGFANAAADLDLPAVIAFTVETDGNLPSGQTLREAIETVDGTAKRRPEFYMINCAHPTHFTDSLAAGEPWLLRIGGIRANASCKSHAELDASTELDPGNPAELGAQYRELLGALPNLKVLGGCCGTDHTHIEAICVACITHDRHEAAVPGRPQPRNF
jgi:S-methylmethionine-dependent homocysteine/selenocysteine methylase